MSKEDRRSHWRRLLKEQGESGLSAAAFCRDRNINLYQFYRWRRRMRSKASKGLSGQFLELVPSSCQRETGVRVRVSEHLCIEVERGFDPATLRAVIETLDQGYRCSP
jgi:hypothetical protein